MARGSTYHFINEYWWLDNPKYPSANDGIRLLDFYFWGINHHFPSNHPSRAMAFIKLFYNMDPRYRVRSKDEFEDINRDAGPRLLRPEILTRLRKQPISRDYPDIPHPDDWQTQRLLPFRRSPAQEKEDQERAQEKEVPEVPEETPENLDEFREKLERLLIEPRYRDLEVDQSIEKSQPWAATLELLQGPDHTFTLNSEGMSYPSGYGPSATEREPGWNLACDCMMMAGKFLNAGITNIDMKEMRSGELQVTHMHRLLTNAVKMNWDYSVNATSTVQQRHNFHQNFLRNDFQSIHDLIEHSTLLRKQFVFTSEEAEFCEDNHKKVIRKPTFFRHKNLPTRSDNVDISDLLQEAFDPVSPESSPSTEQDQEPRAGSSVQTCSVKDCRKRVCNSRVCHTMPLRLAIYPQQDVVPENHTSDDIRFTITNSKGKKERVVYRWLGGIYSNSKNVNGPDTCHRVYWTDDTRGETKASSIRMYDPLLGCYIGGIMSVSDGSLIPRKWQPSVIFYECVLNPNPLDITLVTAIVGDIGHAVHTDQRILQVHKPWNSRAESNDHGQIWDVGAILGTFDNGNTTNTDNMLNPNEFPTIPENASTDNITQNTGRDLPSVQLWDLLGRPMEANPSSSDLKTGNQPNYSNSGSFSAQNNPYTYQSVPQQTPQPFSGPFPFVAQPSGSAVAPSHVRYSSSGTSNTSGMTPSSRSINIPRANGYRRTQMSNSGLNGINGSTTGVPQRANGTQNGNQGTPYPYMYMNGNGHAGMQHFGESFSVHPENSACLGGQPAQDSQQLSEGNAYYGNNLQSPLAPELNLGQSPSRKRTSSVVNGRGGKRPRAD